MPDNDDLLRDVRRRAPGPNTRRLAEGMPSAENVKHHVDLLAETIAACTESREAMIAGDYLRLAMNMPAIERAVFHLGAHLARSNAIVSAAWDEDTQQQ